MNISTKSWHFKLFNVYEGMPEHYYREGAVSIDICRYFRIITIELLLIGALGLFALLIGFFFLMVLLEPFCVIGNYMLGNGWAPVLELWLGKEDTNFGLFWAGVFMWVAGGICGIIAYLYKEDFFNRMKNEARHGTGFKHVAYQRYIGWKEKHCTLINFTDE